MSMSCWPEKPDPYVECSRKKCGKSTPLRLITDGLCPPCWSREQERRMAWRAVGDLWWGALQWFGVATVFVIVVVGLVKGWSAIYG